MRLYVRELNHFYLKHKPLYEVEDSWSGFQWLVPNDRDNAVAVFCRYDSAGNAIICASNFTPTFHPMYRFGLPLEGTVSEVLNSDLDKYGGSNQHNLQPVQAQQIPSHGLPYSVDVCLPPLATVYFHYDKGIAPQTIQELKEE
jgi:1,4-alpha-glucan branching enzyme